MIIAKIDKSTLLVVNVEVASIEWMNDWNSNHPDDATFYSQGAYEGEYAAGIGWTFDEPTSRFIPPTPDEPGTWVFDRELWEWVNLDAPPEEPDDDPETPA